MTRLSRLAFQLVRLGGVLLGGLAFGGGLPSDPISSPALGGRLLAMPHELPAEALTLQSPLGSCAPDSRQCHEQQGDEHDNRDDEWDLVFPDLLRWPSGSS